MFHMVQSRVHLELGLARAATLPGFSISELVRRGPLSCTISGSGPPQRTHRYGSRTRVTIEDHLFEACECVNVISGRMKGLPVYRWVEEVSKTMNVIGNAVCMRGADFQRHILVDPLPALSRFSGPTGVPRLVR